MQTLDVNVSAPHIRSEKTVSTVMRDVIIALTPAIIGSALFFSFRAIVIIALSVISCVGFEYLYNLVFKKEQTITDLSAVVTGILLAFCMPVSAPVWLVIIGSAFAILVVKMLFGGIGKNLVNPALAARIFLLLSFSGYMTTYLDSSLIVGGGAYSLPLFKNVDVVSGATPLSYLKANNPLITHDFPSTNMFIGVIGGSIGETSVLLLIVGGLYLLYKKVITWHIPVSFISTVAVLTFLFPKFNDITSYEFMSYNLMSGGLILAAIFMATDCATSPVSPKGRIIYGIGCGVITVFIRYYAGYPDGVSFAIIIMNFLSFTIDKHTIPTRFGGESKYAKLFNEVKSRLKK